MTYSERELEFTFAKNEIISVNVSQAKADVFITGYLCNLFIFKNVGKIKKLKT